MRNRELHVRCGVKVTASLALGIANRGRVIAAINRRRPLGRLSKLLSILKQNAFLRFIIVGVMTWSTLAPSLPSFIAVRPSPSTSTSRPLPALAVLPPPVIADDVVHDDDGHVPEPYRPCNTKRSRDIDLRAADVLPAKD